MKSCAPFFRHGIPLRPGYPLIDDRTMTELRRRNRYSSFQPSAARIHPLKRLMRTIASGMKRPARFFIFGLPARQENLNACGHGPLVSVPRGIAAALGANLTVDGQYIADLTAGAGPHIESRFLAKQRCFPRVARRRGTIVSLIGDGDRNYFRWLLETLPRLRFLEEADDRSRPPIYACQNRAFHRESLRLLAGPDVEIIPSDRVPYLRAEELLVPRLVDENEVWIVPWLRRKILPSLPAPAPGTGPQRLYLSRRKATGRKIANEAELVALLAEFGFVTVTPEDMGWLDQVRLFHGAQAVIGPHGAGLANLVFCRPGTLVLELIAREYPFTFYPQISAQVGLEHQCLFSEPTDPRKIHASDLLAPLAQVRLFCQKLAS